ncbi:MAG: hypothetical protein ACRD0J_05430 [Acidimicrobiales bacterium]
MLVEGDLGLPVWVGFEEAGEALAALVDPAALATEGIGPIEHRRSRMRPEGYFANGCLACDAVQGNFPLFEELAEYQTEGGCLDELPVVAVVDLPAGLLDYAEDLDPEDFGVHVDGGTGGWWGCDGPSPGPGCSVSVARGDGPWRA